MENLHSYLRDTLNFSALEPFREKAQAASAQGKVIVRHSTHLTLTPNMKAAAKSIWNLLKISAVTYAVSAVYLVAMHDLMKRMQVKRTQDAPGACALDACTDGHLGLQHMHIGQRP